MDNLTPTDTNPIHLLDFRRFKSGEVANSHRKHIDVLRKHAPSADLLHNFMGFFTTIDHYRFAKDNALDVVAWESYPIAPTESIAPPDEQKARYARTAHPDVPCSTTPTIGDRRRPFLGDGAASRSGQRGAVESGAGERHG